MSQWPPYPEADEPVLPNRRMVAVEDALILVCLGLLWLPMLGLRGTWVTALLVVDLATMVVVMVRRKRRVDRLFEEWRRLREEQQRLGAYPGVPGMIPPRQEDFERVDLSVSPPPRRGRRR